MSESKMDWKDYAAVPAVLNSICRLLGCFSEPRGEKRQRVIIYACDVSITIHDFIYDMSNNLFSCMNARPEPHVLKL